MFFSYASLLSQNVHYLHTPLSSQPVRTKSVTMVAYKRTNVMSVYHVIVNSRMECAMVGWRQKTCFCLAHNYCHRMYTTYTHHLALNQSEQKRKQAQG